MFWFCEFKKKYINIITDTKRSCKLDVTIGLIWRVVETSSINCWYVIWWLLNKKLSCDPLAIQNCCQLAWASSYRCWVLRCAFKFFLELLQTIYIYLLHFMNSLQALSKPFVLLKRGSPTNNIILAKHPFSEFLRGLTHILHYPVCLILYLVFTLTLPLHPTKYERLVFTPWHHHHNLENMFFFFFSKSPLWWFGWLKLTSWFFSPFHSLNWNSSNVSICSSWHNS